MTDSTAHLMPVYTGEQIRAAERPLLDSGHGPALMRCAAYGLAQCIASLLQPDVRGSKVTALIGSGNNGGDGLHALAFLARRGAEARAILVRDKAHQTGLQAFLAEGGRLVEAVPEDTDVLVDAILGTGFRGQFSTPQIPGLTEFLGTHDDAAAPPGLVVACDLPSGVNADTGASGDGALRADHTVTFGGLKQGLLVGRGGLLSGQLHSVDIGLGEHLPNTLVRNATAPVPASRCRAGITGAEHVGGTGGRLQIRLPPPPADAHKYSRGVLHIVAGSQAYPGAAHLAAAAALRSGTGMVTLEAPQAVLGGVIVACPEVVGVAEQDSVGAVDRAAGVVVGPGIGTAEAGLRRAEAALEQALTSGTACVLDASGLGLIPGQLRRHGGLNKNVLITPHLGEARNLASALRDRVLGQMLEQDSKKADPVEAALRIAGKLDCTVLLKGPTTVIASPHGDVVLHRAQAPGLATAGTGDVLSGILGALAAGNASATVTGLPWWQVATIGAQMHSAAAHRIDPQGRGRFGASQLIPALGPESGLG